MISLIVFTDNYLRTQKHFILHEIHYIFIIQQFIKLQNISPFLPHCQHGNLPFLLQLFYSSCTLLYILLSAHPEHLFDSAKLRLNIAWCWGIRSCTKNKLRFCQLWYYSIHIKAWLNMTYYSYGTREFSRISSKATLSNPTIPGETVFRAPIYIQSRNLWSNLLPGIHRWFSILSHDHLSPVIPNYKRLEQWRL